MHGVVTNSLTATNGARLLHEATGAEIITPDFRGYGLSTGTRFNVDYVGHYKDWLTMSSVTLWWLGGLSLLSFFGTLILVPVRVMNRLADDFVREQRRDDVAVPRHPVV